MSPASAGSDSFKLAAAHLNPRWVSVLRILGLDIDLVRAEGSCLYDADGRRYLDFHTGEGVASLGYNNPRVKRALRAVLDEDLPGGIQIHYHHLAGRLASELCSLATDRLESVFFANSGSEVVEAAMKFSRAATGRPKIVSCQEAFHGLTYGALSLAGEDYFKEGFGPMLPGCQQVPHGDLDALERVLQRRDVAAFVIEPVQGRTVRIPDAEYLVNAQRLCRRYGTLLVADEIQTGLGRTGKMFAYEHWDLDPDVVLLAKALSGGLVPVGAMLYTREIYDRVFSSLRRSYVHHSTFGRNNLAMAAGLATLEEIREENLVDHVAKMGALVQRRLAAMTEQFELVFDSRVLGLMFAIELGPPKSLKMRLHWKAIKLAGEGLFAQIVVRPLLVKHGIISMVSGENDVIKFLPPINMSEQDLDTFLTALQQVLADIHDHSSQIWSELMRIAAASGKTIFQS